jgi:hypothetical protein
VEIVALAGTQLEETLAYPTAEVMLVLGVVAGPVAIALESHFAVAAVVVTSANRPDGSPWPSAYSTVDAPIPTPAILAPVFARFAEAGYA